MTRFLAKFAALAALLLAGVAQADDPVVLEFGGRQASELRLPIGRSQIISSPVSLEQVVIGAPEVADIKLLSAGRVLILGIKPGRTNLVFRQKGGDLVALMDVVVGYDLNGIKQKVAELMPAEKGIEVRGTNDRVILTGQASSLLAMDTALQIARSYVPTEKVVNLMQVGGGQQVMLKARIAEVSRTSMKELGLQTSISDRDGSWNIITGRPIANAFGTITGRNYDGSMNDNLTTSLQALEEKGLARTLAEPNLVALSGQEANFLAGGEIPIPVAQSSTAGGAITVEYKEFGVGLRFTPTVIDAEKVNLKLLSEVSAIDTSNAFNIGSGIRIPAITTRRAGTTIEMADGQSFAIAGLMENNLNDAIAQMPWLGDIPVLGALFRSSDYQRKESELVVVVTVHLVKPVSGDRLQLPTDSVANPDDIDLYLLGRLEGTAPARTAGQRNSASGGGMEGSFGHQVNAQENPQ